MEQLLSLKAIQTGFHRSGFDEKMCLGSARHEVLIHSCRSGTATSSPSYAGADPIFSRCVAVLWEMKKNGYAESTIVATDKRLKHLSRHCDLNDPESVKGFVANKQCTNGFKESLIEAYDLWCRHHGI